jgi:hypothetical protein
VPDTALPNVSSLLMYVKVVAIYVAAAQLRSRHLLSPSPPLVTYS